MDYKALFELTEARLFTVRPTARFPSSTPGLLQPQVFRTNLFLFDQLPFVGVSA